MSVDKHELTDAGMIAPKLRVLESILEFERIQCDAEPGTCETNDVNNVVGIIKRRVTKRD